jgi:hypothetical protein
MIAARKQAAKIEIHTAKPKANIYVIFPFSLFSKRGNGVKSRFPFV